MTYSFLVLSILLALPGALIWMLRADLRPMLRILAIASIPFAFTELLFYPTYWKPVFLFDLVNIIGFGVEDIIFVVGLSAFASGSYPAIFGKAFLPPSAPTPSLAPKSIKRAVGTLALCFFAVFVLAMMNVPMIYGSFLIMGSFSLAILALRRDLLPACLGGALVTGLGYTLICMLLAALIPEVFELDWNTDKFTNIFILGIPLEEIVYATLSGAIAAIFYPFITGSTFVPHRRVETNRTDPGVGT